MRNLLLMLTFCAMVSCKKDLNKQLINNKWQIESSTVTPAMTINNKTSTDYLSLMGPESCEAKTELSFNGNGTFSQVSYGALCDLAYDPMNKNSVKWTRDNDQIILSTSPDSPFILSGNSLSNKTEVNSGGTVYIITRVYKAR